MINKLIKVGILGASVLYVKNNPRNKLVSLTNQRPEISRSREQPRPIRSPFLINAEELKQPADNKTKECILGILPTSDWSIQDAMSFILASDWSIQIT